jgi:hypothetical protein
METFAATFHTQTFYQVAFIIKSFRSFSMIVFLCIVLSLLACGFSEKDSNCDRFKQGNFRYRFRGQNYQTDFLIHRNDSVQTEVDSKSGKTSKLSVKWTGECKYELRLLETTFDFPDSVQGIRKILPTKTEILSSTKDYYIFQTTRENSDFVMTDTLWVEK